MMFLLAIPLVRNLLIGAAALALLAGAYAGWSWHLKELGAAQERAAAEERAQTVRDTVIKKSDMIEKAAPKSAAQKELLKEWSRGND
jgi:hypothetical protein